MSHYYDSLVFLLLLNLFLLIMPISMSLNNSSDGKSPGLPSSGIKSLLNDHRHFAASSVLRISPDLAAALSHCFDLAFLRHRRNGFIRARVPERIIMPLLYHLLAAFHLNRLNLIYADTVFPSLLSKQFHGKTVLTILFYLRMRCGIFFA